MKTRAVRLYGKEDLRLEEFDLPPIRNDEILVKIVSDSLCMSSYKAVEEGADHKRVPGDIAANPTIIGHEFCGEIVEVGARWRKKFKAGETFAIQPAFYYNGSLDAPGYSYPYCGGDATYAIIPPEAMITGSLFKYDGNGFFAGSLAEPMSCIVGGFHAFYHTTRGSYVHEMGNVIGGNMAILGGAGPMGLGAVDYALHFERKPALLTVTDIDEGRLENARQQFTKKVAARAGVGLHFINTRQAGAEEKMMALTGGAGYDDILVMAPVRPVVEQADRMLSQDGCLNFFAGPIDSAFSALFNFYNVHYASTHVTGTSGGNTGDMQKALNMMASKRINPAAMITHIGGLNCVVDTTLHLPDLPGGKKLIYTHIDMPLIAIEDFAKLGETDDFYKKLAEIVQRHNGLWNAEAEAYLLKR
jgi:threonine dehydrogenase-like Zn-dependent dehydrogenase